ncbi:MAG: hypothetical protein K2Y40_12610 [Reyranella sp.]|nr:hypothetical protein [Reyranella sp.]
MDKLDGVARALARVAGYDAGVRLVTGFGGQRVFVPRTIRQRSRFWDVLGPTACRELAKLFGGEHITVPTGLGAERRLSDARRRRQVEAFLRAHKDPRLVSKDKVAEALKVHRRTVQRVRVAMTRQTEPSPQGSLFEKTSKRV